MSGYYSENYPFYNVANNGGSGGNPGDANKGLYQHVGYNNSTAYTGAAYTGAAYTGAANTGSNTLVEDPDGYERFGTTKAKDYGSYWLCENLPVGDEYRVIMKIHADAQVRAAPGRAAWMGYPKRHNNREGNDLSVSGNLLEFPLLPGTFNIWARGTRPGPVRAIYREDDGVGDRPYDVVYHDRTKPQPLDFTKAALV